MKRLPLELIVILMMSILSGCKNGYEQQMVYDYLEDKYGETFEYSSPWGNSLYGDHELFVTCDSLDSSIYVVVKDYRETTRTFHDNYVAVMYEEQTEQFMRDCIGEFFSDFHLYYDTPFEPCADDLNKQSTFEEYISDQTYVMHISVAVPIDSIENREQILKMAEKLGSYGTRFRLMFSAQEITDYNSITGDERVDDDDLNNKVSLKEVPMVCYINHINPSSVTYSEHRYIGGNEEVYEVSGVDFSELLSNAKPFEYNWENPDTQVYFSGDNINSSEDTPDSSGDTVLDSDNKPEIVPDDFYWAPDKRDLGE